MKSKLKEEQGAALVVALLTIVMMTMLGMILLDVLQNSRVNSSISKHRIQSDLLAQQGLDEVISVVKKAVDNGNATGAAQGPINQYRSGVDAVKTQLEEDLRVLIDDPVADLTIPVSYEASNQTGTYRVNMEWKEISMYDAVPPAIQGSTMDTTFLEKPFVYELVATSVGTNAISPQVPVTKKTTIYVSTIEPVFRYPLSAEENLVLNGSPYIVGDVLVRSSAAPASPSRCEEVGNVCMNQIVPYRIGTNARTFDDGHLPAVQGFIHANAYSINGQTPSSFQRSFFTNQQPFEDTRLLEDTDIDIEAIVNQMTNPVTTAYFAGQAPARSVAAPADDTAAALNQTLGADTTNGEQYTGSQIFVNEWVTLNHKLRIEGSLVVENGVLFMEDDSDVILDAHASQRSSLVVTQTDPDLIAAFLGGTLSIPDDEFVIIEGDVMMSNFTFEGRMFVKGNVYVIGDLNMKGSLYVDGDLELKEANEVNQKDDSDAGGINYKEQPVMMASSGQIVLSDNVQEHKLRAFLYARGEMDLYGVASNLEINGGIHGKKVTLSAVKGDTDQNKDSNGNVTSLDIQSNQATLTESDSRMRIYHDLTLFSNPPLGIPVSRKVNAYVQHIQYVE
ncbi:hypothetical protein [Marinicrinis sediminis]|uniref:Type 4 fimbrial biogenesis protein PilX N-terminal domain-containing protein n=1 Tax=Marinicrinis sediminis TaxID=1652465 RepID=A0ABW5RBW5_9BACL